MSLERFLQKVTGLLDQAGIPFMVTGSLGSVFHGEPRASRDVDFVIAPTGAAQLDSFVELAKRGFYVSPEEARAALTDRSLFNLVDLETGWKADLVILKAREHSRVEFERRRTARILGMTLPVVSAEDAILSKLEWSRESRSDLHRRDALGVAIAQQTRLDRAYLRQWADVLGVRDRLEALLAEADRT